MIIRKLINQIMKNRFPKQADKHWADKQETYTYDIMIPNPI